MSVDSAEWKTLSLTFVSYPKDDYLGQLLAILSLLPLVILVGFGTLILFKRDLHTIFLCAGQVGNELCNVILKRWFKEPRPVAPGAHETHWGKYGFPSSHTQFMTFFSVYLALFIFVRLLPDQTGKRVKPWKILCTICLLSSSFAVAYGRIYLGQHTYRQVCWGGIIGALLAVLYFLFVHLVCSPYFHEISCWRVCEYLLITDCTLIPSVLYYQYRCVKAEAKARSRKHSLKMNRQS